eukprot:TRINITY_DN3666_c0_g1_i9.p1 TRINITY_DN3666_c0_g1~~TRINITY_DN3666_c0_g1_i9.p1  ORF type:complete len:685 (-),score=139.03 TRINITY_DN3666_c0_g1_i9:260-2314(-)
MFDMIAWFDDHGKEIPVDYYDKIQVIGTYQGLLKHPLSILEASTSESRVTDPSNLASDQNSFGSEETNALLSAGQQQVLSTILMNPMMNFMSPDLMMRIRTLLESNPSKISSPSDDHKDFLERVLHDIYYAVQKQIERSYHVMDEYNRIYQAEIATITTLETLVYNAEQRHQQHLAELSKYVQLLKDIDVAIQRNTMEMASLKSQHQLACQKMTNAEIEYRRVCRSSRAENGFMKTFLKQDVYPPESGFTRQNKTAIVTDDRFYLYPQDDEYESAGRLTSAFKSINYVAQHYYDEVVIFKQIDEDPYINNAMRYIKYAHLKTYIDKILESKPVDVHIMTAYAAAVCQTVDLVLKGKARNAFCLGRPSGNHCGRNGPLSLATVRVDGIFNHAAIAAKYARITQNLARVAVVDFSLRHGSGSQEILADDPGVKFISSHLFHPRTGMTGGASIPEQGIINVPYQLPFNDYIVDNIQKRFLHELELFKPELIVVSSGFDGHVNDPMLADTNSGWTSESYYKITQSLCSYADANCDGRLVSILEGGYDLENGGLFDCVTFHLLALLNKPMTDPFETTVAASSDPALASTADEIIIDSSSDGPGTASALNGDEHEWQEPIRHPEHSLHLEDEFEPAPLINTPPHGSEEAFNDHGMISRGEARELHPRQENDQMLFLRESRNTPELQQEDE